MQSGFVMVVVEYSACYTACTHKHTHTHRHTLTSYACTNHKIGRAHA